STILIPVVGGSTVRDRKKNALSTEPLLVSIQLKPEFPVGPHLRVALHCADRVDIAGQEIPVCRTLTIPAQKKIRIAVEIIPELFSFVQFTSVSVQFTGNLPAHRIQIAHFGISD
ncbi:MAG: hypothetical protein AAFV07_09270, partial [Bacteroidota bacterium]